MSRVPAAILDKIPSHVLDKILCQLPIKCLLRLKSVSKSWHAQISSPEFVKFHLDRSAKTKINLSLFLWGFKLYRVDFDSLHDNNAILELAVVDDHPLNNIQYCLFELWGSCNGLICMSNSNDNADTVFLWNPSTRKSIKLPHISVEIPNQSDLEQESIYGIGYTDKDYKVGRVVEIRDLNGEFLDYEVMVYSLNSNSWTRSEKFHLCPNIWRTGSRNTIVGGSMHWFSRLKPEESEEETLIVALDLVTEKYREIRQPEFRDPDHFPTYLHSLGECLSLTCHYNLTTADIWLLKNYGKWNESWMRLITMFPVTNPALMVHLIPVDYSKCGKKVLLDVNYEKLVWYDLEQRSVEDIIRVEDMALHTRKEDVLAAITCLESLASVESSRRSKESVSRD